MNNILNYPFKFNINNVEIEDMTMDVEEQVEDMTMDVEIIPVVIQPVYYPHNNQFVPVVNNPTRTPYRRYKLKEQPKTPNIFNFV
jgi:hypothetical protein